MAHVRSLRDIPLDQEPHASVLAALTPDPTESPYREINELIMDATLDQAKHLEICPRCREMLGIGQGHAGVGQIAGITTDTLIAQRKHLLGYHNDARGPSRVKLVQESTLTTIAQNYANRIASTNWWPSPDPHLRQDGKCYAQWWNTVAPVAWRCGAGCSPSCPKTIGENLARNFPNASSVQNAWMNSATHRANILKDAYRTVGIGIAQARNGYWYWCVEFRG